MIGKSCSRSGILATEQVNGCGIVKYNTFISFLFHIVVEVHCSFFIFNYKKRRFFSIFYVFCVFEKCSLVLIWLQCTGVPRCDFRKMSQRPLAAAKLHHGCAASGLSRVCGVPPPSHLLASACRMCRNAICCR